MKKTSVFAVILFALAVIVLAAPGRAAEPPQSIAAAPTLSQVPLSQFLSSLNPATSPAEGLNPLKDAVQATCPSTWCTEDDEYNCQLGCSPCDYTFTCNPTLCTERCRCLFATCPV